MTPYTESEIRRPGGRDSCPSCGTLGSRLEVRGFGGRWRVVCRCGYEYESGRGKLPAEGE